MEKSDIFKRSKRYTKYEKARLIGARALQIRMGAPILVPFADLRGPMEIAKRELEQDVIPLVPRYKDPSRWR